MLKEIDNGKNKIKTTKKTKKALEKIYYEKKKKMSIQTSIPEMGETIVYNCIFDNKEASIKINPLCKRVW